MREVPVQFGNVKFGKNLPYGFDIVKLSKTYFSKVMAAGSMRLAVGPKALRYWKFLRSQRPTKMGIRVDASP